MSQKNVEIVRAAIEAYIDGDHDAYRAVMAEDAEVCPDVSPFPEAKQLRGRAEYGRFLTEIHQGWEGGAG
jgi:ketosteroid isomerase-like protein